MIDAIKLAEDIERAPAERERELFLKIKRWMEPRMAKKVRFNWAQYWRFIERVEIGAYLSAADVLRPEKFGRLSVVEHLDGSGFSCALTQKHRDGIPQTENCPFARAATEPMARAAAGLRAHDAMETEDGC